MLDELLVIHDQFELLRAKNGYEPGDEMNSLWKKCFTWIQRVPVNIEYRLTRSDQFRTLASSICQLAMKAEMVEELKYSEQLQYPNSLSTAHSCPEVFIHYKNVIQLEMTLIKIVMKSPIQEIVFVGCGPLPLSSIELIIQLPELKRILSIDYDPKAIELAKSFVEHNCSHFASEKMSFLKIGACELTRGNVKNAQLIYYGAMVGENHDGKNKILKHIYEIMLDGQVLLVRTSRGLRQIFYPQIHVNDLQELGFKLQLEAHLHMDVDIITSILIVIK